MATQAQEGQSSERELVIMPGNEAIALAARPGTVKTANLVMLGAVASALPFTAEAMEAVIRRSVPAKTIDVNLEAFRLGRTITNGGRAAT